MTSKYEPSTTPARTWRGSPRPTIVKVMVENCPSAVRLFSRSFRSTTSGTENVEFSIRFPGALWRMYTSRLSSRLTSGLRRTPRTTLKIDALAPMPSASVRMTVADSPLARASERRANLRS